MSIPSEVTLKDSVIYQVIPWKLDGEIYNKVRKGRSDYDSVRDKFGVLYSYYQKDSNGSMYDRVSLSFSVKEDGFARGSVSIFESDNNYILKSYDGKHQTCVTEKELNEKYIATVDLPDYLQTKKTKSLIHTCVDLIHRALLEKAVRRWGKDAQLLVMAEECSELIKAILKVVSRGKKDKEEDIVEELADVIIMANQLVYIYGEERVKKHIEFKMNRVRERLEK